MLYKKKKKQSKVKGIENTRRGERITTLNRVIWEDFPLNFVSAFVCCFIPLSSQSWGVMTYLMFKEGKKPA